MLSNTDKYTVFLIFIFCKILYNIDEEKIKNQFLKLSQLAIPK